MKYKDIQHLRISEISEENIRMWVLDEITDLSNDFGNSLDNEQILHIGRRVFEKLNTTYRSWCAGDVHAAFQTGLSGAYGSFRKVTVQALFHFLKSAQNQMSVSRAVAAEIESERNRNRVEIETNYITDFICWATVNMICLEYVHPEWNPLQEREVSPKIKALADEYHTAKAMNKLYLFENKLRNEALRFAEV